MLVYVWKTHGEYPSHFNFTGNCRLKLAREKKKEKVTFETLLNIFFLVTDMIEFFFLLLA